MRAFFKNIYERVSSSDTYGKRISYALGEIVLIILGIFIALQLDNYNDEIKTESKINEYYDQLLLDFQKEEDYFLEMSEGLNSSIEGIESYRSGFDDPNILIAEILNALTRLDWQVTEIYFKSNTINILQSTGDINLFPVHIKNDLVDFALEKKLASEITHYNNMLIIESYNYAVREFGSMNFIGRMGNQPKLFSHISDENRQIEIIMALESAQEQKIKSEKEMIRVFAQLQLKMEDLEELIREAMR